jgi:hypothetical protein
MAKVIRINQKSPRIIIKQVGAKGEQGIQGIQGIQGPPGPVEEIFGENNIVVDNTDIAHPRVKTDFKLTISDTPPSSPSLHDLWIDTSP